MPNVGPMELIILVVILLLVFGSRRLPEMGRSVGKGMREFKDAVTGNDAEPEAEEEATELTARAVEEDEQPVGTTSEKTDN